MEVKENNKEQKIIKKEKLNVTKVVLKSNNKLKTVLIIGAGGFAALLLMFGVFNKDDSVIVKVKSSLDKLVEKSDLETVNFTYNVIAKQCKNEEKCDKNSNDMNDFEYVLSCKGTITAGIDFEKVQIDIDKNNKKLIVNMPNVGVTDINVISLKFINGNELPADSLADARSLCEKTIKEKSEKDNELLPAAKEQAKVVLESFYKQLLDENYELEVK